MRTRVDAVERHILSEYNTSDVDSHVHILKKIKDAFGIDILGGVLDFKSVHITVSHIQNIMIGPVGYQ